MEKVDYDARLHAVYGAGRQMSPDAVSACAVNAQALVSADA